MTRSKQMSLEKAVSKYISDGESIVLGACLEAMIPFAAAHEIIRQNIKNLTLIAPISDILFDMMIGAGIVDKLVAAWSGNVSAGLGYNYRRSLEKGIPHKIAVEDHSNFTIGLALLAGAMGVPFLPTRSLLGSDLLRSNHRLRAGTSPIGDETLVYVPALAPDTAVLGVQRSDEFGNAHLWGNMGVAQEAALASKKVILLAEEIVPKEIITSDPNRLLVPGFKVTAVVHCPAFCHPSPMPGYYRRDHDFFHDYHKETKDMESFQKWLNKWVLSFSSHEEYIQHLGCRLEELKIKQKSLAAEVNYAYE